MNQSIQIVTETVAQYANSIPGLNLIFGHMEKVEKWVVSKGNDKGFLAALNDSLMALTPSEIELLCLKKDEIMWLLFFLPTSTSFYLLDALRGIEHEISNDLIKHASQVMLSSEDIDKRHAQVFLDRCNHLNAGKFMAKIVDEDFTQSLLEAIEYVKKEGGRVY